MMPRFAPLPAPGQKASFDFYMTPFYDTHLRRRETPRALPPRHCLAGARGVARVFIADAITT